MIPSFQEFKEGKHFTTTKGNKMAELNYNADAANAEEKKIVPRVAGTWSYAIVDAKLITAKSGTEGINVTMEVDQDGTILKSFDTFWLSDNALFRLKAASVAAGKDMPKEDFELIGWTGKAVFGIDDKGYFKVEKYITGAETASEPQTEGSNFKEANTSDW